MAKATSDRYIRFYGPILDALRELGGSASPREVKEKVITAAQLSDEELARTLKGGENAVANEIHWARDYLRRLGLIDGSVRGVWTLTEPGAKTYLTLGQARELRSGLYSQLALALGTSPTPSASGISEEDEPAEESAQAPTLLETIKALSPPGFERLCQRLLREAGFIEVKVTGQSGDGGIDGHGILQMNELVSFRVVFQCKRYQGSVGPGMVRDFRGGVGTGTDKAILLTTGTFTKSAEDEASKAGLFPIELVDGERLVGLMERLQLGVRPRTVYDVDQKFFDEYR
ncbi:MAG: restriction endonuclease [Fimbriimonas sp.]